jgi:hypothetical protein
MAGLETETVHYCYKINGQVKIYDLGFYISRIASGFWIHVALSLILFFFSFLVWVRRMLHPAVRRPPQQHAARQRRGRTPDPGADVPERQGRAGPGT